MPLAEGAARGNAPLDRGAGCEDRGPLKGLALLVRRRRSFQFFKIPCARREPDGNRLRLALAERASIEAQTPHAELRALSAGESSRSAKCCGAVGGGNLSGADEQQSLHASARRRQVQRLVAAPAKLSTLERPSKHAGGLAIESRQLLVDRGASRQSDDEHWR